MRGVSFLQGEHVGIGSQDYGDNLVGCMHAFACRRCAVHDGAKESGCDACTQEPDCGFCYNFNSGLCLPGNTTSSEDGSCPGGKGSWTFEGDVCEAPEEEAAIALALGEQTYQKMKIGENLLCAVGPCMETAFKVALVNAQVLNIQATLAVLPQDAVVQFTSQEIRGLGADSSPASVVNREGFIAGAQSTSVGPLDLGAADVSNFAEQTIIHSSCGRNLADVSLFFKLALETVSSREEVDAFFVASQVSSTIKLRQDGEMTIDANGDQVPVALGEQTWLLCCNQYLHLSVDTSGLQDAAGTIRRICAGHLVLPCGDWARQC